MKIYLNQESRRSLLNLIRTLPKKDFYGHKVSSFKFQRKSRLSLTDFYKLPLITREDLYLFQAKKKKNNLQKSLVMRARADVHGNEMQFPLSLDDYNRLIAFEKYKFEKIGVKKTDTSSIIYFPLDYIIPMAEALMQLGASYIPIEGTLEQVLAKILDYKLTMLFSTPKTVSDLIKFAKKTKRRSNLRLVITAGQKIPNFNRFARLAKQYLGAEVVDHIGSFELSGFAFRCRQHNQYHFIDKYQVVEIINPESMQPASEGELVITSLWRRDFPLIRYRTGDYVQIKKKIGCQCEIRDPRVFSGVIRRIGDLTKINGILVSLEEIYERVRQNLLFQYPMDGLIWSRLAPPDIFLILDEGHVTDRIFIYINKLIYQLTLRKKRPIEQYLKSFLGITPQIILVEPRDSKELGVYRYMDIRGGRVKLQPKKIQTITKKY